ncbi:UbiA family prenyltransferase [Candidatus Aerophobetes bacterium]|nr:UbiA family prenyltransferase [Candidatus Aerophobetes bacterium]
MYQKGLGFDKIVSYFFILRPPLLLLGILAPYSLMVYYGKWGTEEAWYILLAIAFGNCAFNIFNEIADRNVDKVLKPWKPIPSGRVDLYIAPAIALSCWVLSYWFLLHLDLPYLYLGVLGYLGAFIYNVMQVREVVGNLVLGATYAVAAYMATYPYGLEFVVPWMLLVMGFNIAVQVQDVEGDVKVGLQTVPVELGVRNAKILSGLLSIVAGALFLRLDWHFYPFFMASWLVLGANIFNEYEVFCRYLGRLSMIIGFGLLLL